jgi:hypothetical protein
MAKKLQGLILCLLVLLMSSHGCVPADTMVGTGPIVYADGGAVEVELGFDINSNGELVLKQDYSLSTIGPVGVGWHLGTEQVLKDVDPQADELVLLWEDASGQIWRKIYDIGQPFAVSVDDLQPVREIWEAGGSTIVALASIGSVPGYDDLQDDIQNLIERWDLAHYAADRYWDTGDLPYVLRGAALEQQKETVDWLKSNTCYWEIDELMTPQITYLEAIGTQSLLVDVRKNWDMDMFCNGSKSKDDDGYFTVRYQIDQIDGAWYITTKEVTARK